MEKRRKKGAPGAVRVLAVFLFGLLTVLAAGGQDKPVAFKPDDPYIGTWINTEYEGPTGMAAKLVIYPDGRELDYLKISDAEPEMEGKFSFEEVWTDEEGNHWYKVRAAYDYTLCSGQAKGQPWKWLMLVRINAAGTIMEGVGRQGGYPEELSQIGGAYVIYYKQQ